MSMDMGQIKRGAGKCLTSEMTSFTEWSMVCHVLDIDRFIDKDIKMGQIKREKEKCLTSEPT